MYNETSKVRYKPSSQSKFSPGIFLSLILQKWHNAYIWVQIRRCLKHQPIGLEDDGAKSLSFVSDVFVLKRWINDENRLSGNTKQPATAIDVTKLGFLHPENKKVKTEQNNRTIPLTKMHLKFATPWPGCTEKKTLILFKQLRVVIKQTPNSHWLMKEGRDQVSNNLNHIII